MAETAGVPSSLVGTSANPWEEEDIRLYLQALLQTEVMKRK